MEKTIIILKPDAIRKGCVGLVLQRFEDAKFRIVGMKMMQLNEAVLREHYSHLTDKPFFCEIVDFMSSTPVVVVALEGVNAVEKVRKMVGPTDSTQAPKGTIRGDLGKDKNQNIVHASDSVESAEREMNRFFNAAELFVKG
ncbi:MAG: nucleoside-diphosphate kinase [Puniceicoccales bacterium]|jgi:nucleoside-diphosphate kinase|nr:nucleoside-diphosphate kinase [Puniceicoccales bacterium]